MKCAVGLRTFRSAKGKNKSVDSISSSTLPLAFILDGLMQHISPSRTATKPHREKDAAPVPTDIAEKMIALKRKQAAKYVSCPPKLIPLPFLFFSLLTLLVFAFSAMSESKTVQNVRLSLHKALRHRQYHRPAGRSSPPDSHHLRCL